MIPPILSKHKNLWMALAFLLPSVMLTIIAVFYTIQSVDEQSKKEFTSECNEIAVKISTRLHSYAEFLRSGSALFASSGNVNRENWKAFLEASKIEKNLSGIQSLGFVLIVPKKELQKHITTIRNQGFPNYTITPYGERSVYTSVIYLEPFSDRNQRAFGYDMFTEPTQKKAMELSRDSDVAALSGKVKLVQETKQEIQSGTLMYVPVYRNGMPTNDVGQRRKAIIGWVYSPFRMNDLIKVFLDLRYNNQFKSLQLKIYDDSISTTSLIYESKNNDSLKITRSTSQVLSFPIYFNGKRWGLFFSEFNDQWLNFESKVFVVILSGLLINIFLCILILTLLNTKQNALRIANQLTLDLKESESKLKAILDNSIDAIGVHIDGICVFCNNSALNLFGFSKKEEIIGHKIINLIAQSEHIRIQEYINNRLQGRFAPLNYITKGIKNNGKIFDLEVSLSSFDHLNKQQFLVILRDISERIQAENKIISIGTRYQTFLQMASDGIHILNLNGQVVEANNSFCAMLGYTKEEMMRLNFSDWDAQWNKEELASKLEELISIGGLFQTRHRCKDGRIIDVEINCIGIKLEDQSYLYASARDITERKQVELQKELILDRFKKIASRVPGVVYQYLLRPDGRSCFPFASDAIREIFRVTPDEVREDATKVYEAIHPDDFEAVSDSIKKSANELLPWNFEYRVKFNDGTIRWLHGNAIPQKQEDNSVLWHGFITDITKRKELETELQDYIKQLKKSNEDLENFAYVASHDLKAPLNVINGIFNLIDDGKEIPTSTNKLEYIRMAKMAVDQMKRLIKDLLDYSGIGTSKENFSNINLNEVLEYILLLLKDKITQNNAKIIINTLPNIYGNRTLINELFLNLLNNALVYHGINAVEIEIGFTEEKDAFQFFVKDNGIGIHEKDFDKIFIIFKRLHTQSEFEGTGIGLALCKKIVESHKGKIWVESEFGKGSTFYFTIRKQN